MKISKIYFNAGATGKNSGFEMDPGEITIDGFWGLIRFSSLFTLVGDRKTRYSSQRVHTFRRIDGAMPVILNRE